MVSEPRVQSPNPSDKATKAVLARKATGAVAEEAVAEEATGAAAGEASRPGAGQGLAFARRYTTPGVHPYDAVEWERRDAVIGNERGEKIFEQRDVEVPKSWSQTATNVVVSKYFRGQLDTPERETSVRQLLGRVVDTMTGWGRAGGYFACEEDAETFSAELTHVLLHQMACFNSPVWFNVGIEEKPQCSACFINAVEDSMDSILTLAKTEGMLFKYGSGTGSNLSKLRGSREHLAGGGTASGPVSFMRGFDSFAGVIKSGGKTRRAAKMVMLDADHPDILDFIRSKAVEEKKAWALLEAGYDGGFAPGGAYDSVQYQNANHSVRASDELMRAIEADGEWTTIARIDGRPIETHRARDLMREMAEAAWLCGDPGMQYDTTINDWHTCANTDRIRASNPCSEYMFLDDTACNLASLNLMKFYDDDRGFQVDSFRHACEVVITAMEIVVDNASYPTPKIAENSRLFRPLGLGYANLGALLMARGVPYDSDSGRDYAAGVTALMSGTAYAQSARIAAVQGPFEGFAENREPMLRVMRKHREAVKTVDPAHVPLELLKAAKSSWDQVVALGEEHGLRNSQISVLAPTGTIAFMMDCDTTGVEPDIALVKYKKLVGGGMIKIVNQTVPLALKRLGYERDEVQAIVEHIDENDTIEGAPGLEDEHLPVFDCAFKPAKGQRSIEWLGHLKMLSATQPFISGAISKTINMPEDATVDDIAGAYMEGWKLGLKAVAIYRDGSKRSQPLSTKKDEAKAATRPEERRAVRVKLPDERQAVTHKFSVAEHEGYITVGLYENGQPGEIFLTMAKQGSTVSGLVDAFATVVSIALQYGVPLATLVDKLSHTRFEPAGLTKNPQIPFAKSITDYISRWLASRFLSRDEKMAAGVILRDDDAPAPEAAPTPAPAPAAAPANGHAAAKAHANGNGNGSGNGSAAGSAEASHPQITFIADSPSCHECGAIMVRNGSCYKCLNCGSTSGCS